jgi:hypothetical protein
MVKCCYLPLMSVAAYLHVPVEATIESHHACSQAKQKTRRAGLRRTGRCATPVAPSRLGHRLELPALSVVEGWESCEAFFI